MKSFLKMSLAGLVLASLSMAAQATQPGNNGDGNGGCGVGQQTNGCGGTTPTPAPVYNGGAGGTGTGTGIGVGVGIAAAQAAAISASSAVATATQGQVQGQQQGQNQSAVGIGGAGGSARSNATGGTSSATGGVSGGNSLTTGSVTGGAVTVAVEGAKGDTYIAPAQERNPVATAYAAPVVASNGTCMGSSSGGGQGAAIGISFATTWTDNSCDIRYDAEALRAAGLTRAAQARLCQKADIAKAMEAAGTPCPGAEAKRAESILNGTQSVAAYQQVTTASIPSLLP